MKLWCPRCKVDRKVKGFRPAREDLFCDVCDGPLLSTLNRERKPLERRARPRPPRPIATASPAQRKKIAINPFCIACGTEASEWVAVDPAHLTPRGAGGCDDASCVVGLCRTASGQGCHRMFDDGQLDLLVILADRHPAYLPELQHMLEHQTPVEMCIRLANARMEWRQAA